MEVAISFELFKTRFNGSTDVENLIFLVDIFYDDGSMLALVSLSNQVVRPKNCLCEFNVSL